VNQTLSMEDILNLDDAAFEGDVAGIDDYPDPPSPRPLAAGTYKAKLVDLRLDTDENGQVRDSRYPSFTSTWEVVEGEKAGRKATFVKITTRPQNRKRGDRVVKVSPLGDVVRAFDKTYDWGNSIQRAATFLKEQMEQGNVAKVRFDWKAWDGDWFAAQGGDSLPEGSEAKNNLFKTCSIRGQRNFREDGTVNGPSGKELKAKVFLAEAYPSA
jgi:hypothetical protein